MKVRSVALGCLAVPALLLLVGFAILGAAFFMGPVQVTPIDKELDQVIPWAAVSDSSAAVPQQVSIPASARSLDVVLRFEEGSFEIVPGNPGEAIRVDAEYDEGAYRLVPTYREAEDGNDRYELLFERSASLAGLRQLVHRKEDLHDNHVRVSLPPDVPLHLDVRMHKGEGQFDLSGLSLVSLVLDTKMGSVQVQMDRDNPVDMQLCDIRSEMGDMRFYGLGFAAPRALRFQGRMGGFLLDLEGPGRDQIEAQFNLLMGELRVEVPRDISVDVNEQKVMFGELESRDSSPRVAEGDTQRRLLVRATVRLGNIILD